MNRFSFSDVSSDFSVQFNILTKIRTLAALEVIILTTAWLDNLILFISSLLKSRGCRNSYLENMIKTKHPAISAYCIHMLGMNKTGCQCYGIEYTQNISSQTPLRVRIGRLLCRRCRLGWFHRISMSEQPSCGDTCQIWTWYVTGKRYFYNSDTREKFMNAGNWFGKPRYGCLTSPYFPLLDCALCSPHLGTLYQHKLVDKYRRWKNSIIGKLPANC